MDLHDDFFKIDIDIIKNPMEKSFLRARILDAFGLQYLEHLRNMGLRIECKIVKDGTDKNDDKSPNQSGISGRTNGNG